MKFILKFMCSLMTMLAINLSMGSVFAQSLGIDGRIGSAVLIGLGCIPFMPAGVALEGVYTELWTGELIKMFRQKASWLKRVRNMSAWVKFNVIHLVDLGADPEVLINNTTYPIPTVELVDGDVPIGLDRFDTQNTRIRHADLHAASYDIIDTHVERHKAALERKSELKSIHSLALPKSGLADSVFLRTTGAKRADGCNKLTPNDLAAAHVALLEIGANGPFILQLDLKHTLDLLQADEVFAKQYKNLATGEVLPMYGFDIYPTAGIPMYRDVDGVITKNPWGAAADAAKDLRASTFFPLERAVQCMGDVDMYKREASQDPEGRANTIGFSMYHLCLPLNFKGFGAIVDDKKA